MGEFSNIEWCDSTFNPWVGCTAISPGCDNCYAEKLVTGRMGRDFSERRRTSESYWKQPYRWNKKAAALRQRHKVFCASLADVFDNQVPEFWRSALFKVISDTPNLDWLILTKRPQNIQGMLPVLWLDGWPNVWLGTSVENQAEAARRIPSLLSIKSTVHFLSCEPLLAHLHLQKWLPEIDWVICGGESGPKKRPTDLEWHRSLRDQCKSDGVAFFEKQIDKVQPIPPDLKVREFPMVKP